MLQANVFDLNTVSECIVKLIEQVRCRSCWQKEGTRVRCACGIATCLDCAPCPLCLTDSKPDFLLTSRVTNVNHLLYVYENTFDTDVYTRLETLTRLKIERKLFPEAIQAPAKYANKRKSEFGNISSNRRNTLEHSKEMRSHEVTNMSSNNRVNSCNINDSLAHVRKWLDTNVNMTSKTKQRKPLTDWNEHRGPTKQQFVSLRDSTIPTTAQKRHLKPSNCRSYQKRSKSNEILPYIETDTDENTVPSTVTYNNIQNPPECHSQLVPSDGIQFLVTAEIHTPPLIRKAKYRKDGGDGGGGSGSGGSGGSTGSSDKENRDPNLGVRRRRGGGGGDDDDPSSNKRRRPLRQILRSHLGISSK